MEQLACEAEIHHKNCLGYADTVDHFSPKCIEKIRKAKDPFYDPSLLDSPENLIPMYRKCHDMKDRVTPFKKNQIKFQLNGAYITFGRHI